MKLEHLYCVLVFYCLLLLFFLILLISFDLLSYYRLKTKSAQPQQYSI